MNNHVKDGFYPDRSLSSISTESEGLSSPTSPHDLLPPLAALFEPMGLSSGVSGSAHHHPHSTGSGATEMRRSMRQSSVSLHPHGQPQPRPLAHHHHPLDYSESAQLLEDHLRHNYLAYAAVAAANLEDDVHGPPSNSNTTTTNNNVPPSPVELMVTNLDQSIEQRELKSILISMFEPFKVRQINVFTQSDGNTSASVKMASLEDAQLAISRLHRSKVGSKRILINYNNTNTTNPAILRKKVISILKEVPEGRLQLFKFRDMFEKRYASSIGVSDLYKIKDVVSITEEVSGRIVCLNAYAKYFNDENNLDSKCSIHAPSNEGEGWAEKEAGTQLPSVSVSLAILGPNLKRVLKDHQGSAPLYTILHCYNANADFDPLEEDSIDGVPLEHLVSAVKGVQIVSNSSGIKSIVLVSPEEELNNSQSVHSSFGLNHPNNTNHPLGASGMPPTSLGGLPGGPNNLGHLTLTNQLNQLSRYLVDLLKSQKGTKILFQRFIPAYHHQFGTQLRVADYGYTKLKDLLEALPNVIQIIGEGSKSVITLTHRHQVKRFQSDLLKILKGQPNKQVALSEFPKIYEKTFKKEFRVTDYGVCDIDDLLHEISETSVAVSKSGDDILIEVPKREQTLDELERTQTFADECKKLLRHAPECRIPFNKFIPSYHHHFGRQCRVSDYGFSKLMELFESIPQMVDITEDSDGERLIQLTDSIRLSVVGDQIKELIRETPNQTLTVEEMERRYKSSFGYQLRPDTFGYNSILELLGTMNQLIRVEEGEANQSPKIRLIDRSYIKLLSKNVRAILTAQTDGQMKVDEFLAEYEKKFGKVLDLKKVASDLPDLVEILDNESPNDEMNNNEPDVEGGQMSPGAKSIRLVPLQLCVARITELIKEHDKLYCSDLEALFAEKYKTALSPGQYGYPNIKNLLESGLSKHFTIRGRGSRKVICVAKEMPEKSPEASGMSSYFNSAPMPHFRRDGDSNNNNNQSRHVSARGDRGCENNNLHGFSLNRSSLGVDSASSYSKPSSYPQNQLGSYSSHYNMDLLRLSRPRQQPPFPTAPAEPLFPFPPPQGRAAGGYYQTNRDPYYGSMSREAYSALYRDDYMMHAAAAAVYRAELAAAAAALSPHAPPRSYMSDLAKYNIFPGMPNGGGGPREDSLHGRSQNLFGNESVPPNSPTEASMRSATIRSAAAAAISQLSNKANKNGMQGQVGSDLGDFY